VKTRFQVLAVVLVIESAWVMPGWADPSEEDLEEIAGRIAAGQKGPEPAEIQSIDDAIAGKHLGIANKLSAEVVTRESGASSPQREAYIKSLAFLRRAAIYEKLGRNPQVIEEQLAASAKLGNLQAINRLILKYVESAKGGGPSKALGLKGVDIDEILDVGLDLADIRSLQAAVDGFGKRIRSPRELTFYRLLLELEKRDSGFVQDVNELATRYDLAAILTEYAYVGGPVNAKASGSYSRDLLATLLAEENFRGTWATGLGFSMVDTRPEQEPSLREIIAMNTWLTDMSGLATAFHYLTQESNVPYSIALTSAQIGQRLSAGDTIHVRCGGLAHTTVVFKVDGQLDQIFLMDPLYQYWQPSHNSCITNFNLAHYRYGYYLTQLKLSEIAGIVIAVQTFGTYQPPEEVFRVDDKASDKASGGAARTARTCTASSDSADGFLGRHLAPLIRRDLFSFFNLRESTRRARDGQTSVIFMPAAVEFRGDVMLVARTDEADCAQSFSLFLRRSFLSTSGGMFAVDITRSFLNQVFDSSQRSSLNDKSAAEHISRVYSGREELATVELSGATLRIRNFTSETSAKWLRIDSL
jgi:hypothetical protein